MTALSDAEQAVAEAAEAVLWDSNRASITHLITAVRHHDAEMIREHDWAAFTIGVRCCDDLTDDAADLIDPEVED